MKAVFRITAVAVLAAALSGCFLTKIATTPMRLVGAAGSVVGAVLSIIPVVGNAADEALEKVGDHRAGGPFTGGKYSIFEGGTRTPFITRWKGKIKPGVSDEVVCTIDFAASFAAMTGVPVPKDECYDSFDVMGALLGKKGAKGRKELLQQDNGNRGVNLGFRAGKWKLHRADKKSARNVVVEKHLANTPRPQFSLYDLKKDPAEKNNVIAKHPQVAKRMKDRLQKLIDDGRSR